MYYYNTQSKQSSWTKVWEAEGKGAQQGQPQQEQPQQLVVRKPPGGRLGAVLDRANLRLLEVDADSALAAVGGKAFLDRIVTKVNDKVMTTFDEFVRTVTPLSAITITFEPVGLRNFIMPLPRGAKLGAGLDKSTLIVTSVAEGSAACRAGVKTGNRLAAVDGRPVSSTQQLQDLIAAGGNAGVNIAWDPDPPPRRRRRSRSRSPRRGRRRRSSSSSSSSSSRPAVNVAKMRKLAQTQTQLDAAVAAGNTAEVARLQPIALALLAELEKGTAAPAPAPSQPGGAAAAGGGGAAASGAPAGGAPPGGGPSSPAKKAADRSGGGDQKKAEKEAGKLFSSLLGGAGTPAGEDEDVLDRPQPAWQDAPFGQPLMDQHRKEMPIPSDTPRPAARGHGLAPA